MKLRQLPRAFRILGAIIVAGLLAPLVYAQNVKHIILFIGDGMQLEAETGASRYLFGRDTELSFQRLPYKGNVATWDVSAYNINAAALGRPAYNPGAINPTVGYDATRGGYLPFPLEKRSIDAGYLMGAFTDSASAATAWATGHKTDDGNVAWLPGDPAGGSLETIAEVLRSQLGFAIGVASTVPFSHATPAAHVSHNVSRQNFHAIANEIVMTVQPEVVIGGGYASATYMSPEALTYLLSDPSSPYVFVQRRSGVDGGVSLLAAADQAVASGMKLFGLYGNSAYGGAFEPAMALDQPGTPQVVRGSTRNPLLRDMVTAALKVLSRNPNGFFAMFEQGDIDWAAEFNNYQWLVGSSWDLHEAVRTAIEFVDRDGDDIDWGNTLLLVAADHATGYLRLEKPLGAGDLPQQSGGQMGGLLYPTYPGGEVSFATLDHTNELVRLYAKGARVGRINRQEGEWYPCTKILDNTQLFHIMLEAAGLFQPSLLTVLPDHSACRLP